MTGPWRILAVISVVPLVAGCPTDPDFIECRDDTSCFEGGRCLINPETGNQFCAYGDEACPSGMRWSELDVEDSISGACVVPDPETQATLTVRVGGNGSGAVTSDPPGLTCAEQECRAIFDLGTEVHLTATSDAGVFLGWSDACSGSGACAITLDGDAEVGALFGIPGEALWFDQIGGTTSGDITTAIEVDATGAVFVTGEFAGTVDIGGETLTADASQEIFVAKLDGATGLAAWAVHFAPTGPGINARGLAVDAAGDVAVIGSFLGSIDFGGDTLTSAGSSDVFVAKLSGTDGSHLLSMRFGGAGIEDGNEVMFDGNGDLVVAGAYKCAQLPCTTQPSISFGGSTFTNAGQYDLFVAKLAGTTGSHIWSKALGSNGLDGVYGLAVDNADDVVITGEFTGTVNFGGGNRVSAGNTDIFIVKYAGADGAHRFSLEYGSEGLDRGTELATGAAGQIFFLGTFEGTVDFGGAEPLTAQGATSSVVAKYTLAGAHAWSQTITTTGSVLGNGLSASAGGVTMLGSFCGTVTLGETELSSASDCEASDVLLAFFNDSNGAPLTGLRYGGTGSEIGFEVAQTSSGFIYGVGSFTGFAEFGGEGYTSNGGFDAFVVGLGPLQ
jgi:hypothetical protein